MNFRFFWKISLGLSDLSRHPHHIAQIKREIYKTLDQALIFHFLQPHLKMWLL
jgi:hypothetical protein